MNMKKRYFLWAVLFIFALLFGGCDNLDTTNLGEEGGDQNDLNDQSDNDDQDEDDQDDDDLGDTSGILPVKQRISINAVSGVLFGSPSAATGGIIAELALPSTWTVALPAVEDNSLFTIQPQPNTEDGNAAKQIVIKPDTTLEWGDYIVFMNIQTDDTDIPSFTRKIDFAVTETAPPPPPFKKVPTVYPYITGIGKNKLTVSWNERPITTTRVQVYIGTDSDSSIAQPYGDPVAVGTKKTDITDIADDGTEGGLPDGTTYYVWLASVNSDNIESGVLSPTATRTTSHTIRKGFYKDENNQDFYSWDSYTGVVAPAKGGGDMYIIYPPSEDHPGGYLRYGRSGETNEDGIVGVLGGFMGDILYHEAAEGGWSVGRWSEPLNNVNGVFIIEYENHHIPARAEGYYQGIYYYGLNSVETKGPEDGNSVGPPDRKGRRICYFGNSYNLKEMRNPEAKTLEIAMDRFTWKNVHTFIAGIAVPWYRKYTSDPNEW